jgi:hypothetical protein
VLAGDNLAVQEATALPSSDDLTSVSPVTQNTFPSTPSNAPELTAPQGSTLVPAATSSSLQPLQTVQKTQPSAPRAPGKKAPVIVTAFALQTEAVTPPRQLASPQTLSDNERALFQAVINGDNQKIAHLLAAGVSPDVKSKGGWTPHDAINVCRLEWLR